MRLLGFSKSSQTFLHTLSAKQVRQVSFAIFKLLQNPLPNDSIKLKNDFRTCYYRISVGEYRVIYHFDDIAVYVCIIGRRNDGDVCKKFGYLV